MRRPRLVPEDQGGVFDGGGVLRGEGDRTAYAFMRRHDLELDDLIVGVDTDELQANSFGRLGDQLAEIIEISVGQLEVRTWHRDDDRAVRVELLLVLQAFAVSDDVGRIRLQTYK